VTFEWVVLRNPAAGPSEVPEARVVEALERHGVRGVIESPSSIQEMRDAACEIAEQDRAVALVGGDGTISTVVDALAQRGVIGRVVLGVLPAGTGSDLIRTFGIPQLLEDAARHLATPTTYRIDVGRLEGGWGVRYFVNVANSGLAAAVVESAERLPRRLGSARYLAGVAAAAPGFKGCEVELATPRRTHRQHALLVVAANGQFFGGGWNVAPKALLVDGELDTQLVDVPKTAIPRLLPKLVRGMHLSHPGVRRRSLGEFTFTPELDWPVEVDGDLIGHGAFSASMLQTALTLKI
jgi:diacylglycerol kinase (ATP)